MSLHVDVTGKGKPLVMLHGWGMHGGFWSDSAARLARHFQVHCVDLPGHGASDPLDEFTLDNVVGHIAAQFDRAVSVCGWSLGGQVALHWAMLEPDKVERMILVTSTPCFAERNDWPYGLPQETLLQFAADLENELIGTLRRFIGLQVRGSERERELLAELRKQLSSRNKPDINALRGGLGILRVSDLRSVLPKIMQPSLVIAGERDKLCPPQASNFMAMSLPNAQRVLIKGAAHAPFISHCEEFIGYVKDFMNEKQA